MTADIPVRVGAFDTVLRALLESKCRKRLRERINSSARSLTINTVAV